MNKKYLKLFLLEIIGLPLLVTLLAYYFLKGGYDSSTVTELPTGSVIDSVTTSLKWFFSSMVLLSLVNVIVLPVSLIIVSESDKRSIVKKYLIYSFVGIVIAIISWLLISASTQCLGCGGSTSF